MNWLGISIFEIWINVLSLLVFTFLLAFQVDDPAQEELNWWKIFSPLFVANGLNGYFCIIVCIRMYLRGQAKNAFLRFSWTICVLGTLIIFEFMLCRRLNGLSSFEYSEILSPIFVLLQLFAARACQMH